MKKGLLFRLTFGVAMFALVLSYTNMDKLLNVLSHVTWTTIVLLALGYTFSLVISALKWWLLARAAEIDVSFSETLSAFLIGSFVNCFGLGTLGGDVGRAVLITDDKAEFPVALGTVVADRSLGLAVLASIGLISGICFGIGKLSGPLFFVALGVVLLVGIAWVAMAKLQFQFLPHKFRSKIDRIKKSFPSDPKLLLSVVCIALIFHVFQITLFGCMARFLGIPIPWTYLFVAIPFANIVSTLPLSWMGLGIRENVYLFFFSPTYITPEQALTFGALWLLAMTVASAVGGILAVMTGDLHILHSRGAELRSTPTEMVAP